MQTPVLLPIMTGKYFSSIQSVLFYLFTFCLIMCNVQGYRNKKNVSSWSLLINICLCTHSFANARGGFQEADSHPGQE